MFNFDEEFLKRNHKRILTLPPRRTFLEKCFEAAFLAD